MLRSGVCEEWDVRSGVCVEPGLLPSFLSHTVHTVWRSLGTRLFYTAIPSPTVKDQL